MKKFELKDIKLKEQLSKKQLKKKLNNFNLKNRSWFNKKFVAKLFPLFYITEGIVPWMNKRFGDGFRVAVCFIKGDNFIWFWAEEDMKRLREKIIRNNIKNNNFVTNLIDKWKKDYFKFRKAIEKANHQNLKKLSNKELFDLNNKIYRIFNWQLSLPQLVDSFLSSGSKDWFYARLEKYWTDNNIKYNLNNAFQILTNPVYHSFANREKISIYKLAFLINKNKKLKKYFKEKKSKEIKNILNNFPSVKKGLKDHTDNFYWVNNNYYRKMYLDTDYFIKKLKKIIKENKYKKELKSLNKINQKNKKKKQYLYKKLNLSKEIKNIVEIIEQFTLWQDTRKSTVFQLMEFVFNFLEELARRKDITLKELYYLVNPEIKEILLHNRYDKEEIKKRMAGLSYIYFRRGFTVLSDKNNKYFKKEDFLSQNKNKDAIIGCCACPGQVEGEVKIIRGTKDFNKLKKNQILVTNNTTPEFTPILNKAKAIITEQGGMTTHAAIISRELNIPCIIGTKIATEILKDGDKVEVNANKGIVKKIN